MASYNTSFYQPKKDACTVCLAYKNTISKPVEIEKSQKGHRNNVDRSREEKEKDKRRSQTDNTFLAIIIDLEQVSPCPKGNSGDFFYVSKLLCNNLSVYNLGKRDGFCYTWDETIAHRGSEEVGSCLVHFLNNVASHTVTEVAIWADKCAGQNRN